jgi:endo-1,4-beta-xylanase
MNNKCLEIMYFDGRNGAAAGMWDCWGGANQRWYS